MMEIRKLIAELKKFPMDAKAYAYEGEITGIVIRSSNDRRELGHIPATAKTADDGEAHFNKKG